MCFTALTASSVTTCCQMSLPALNANKQGCVVDVGQTRLWISIGVCVLAKFSSSVYTHTVMVRQCPVPLCSICPGALNDSHQITSIVFGVFSLAIVGGGITTASRLTD